MVDPVATNALSDLHRQQQIDDARSTPSGAWALRTREGDPLPSHDRIRRERTQLMTHDSHPALPEQPPDAPAYSEDHLVLTGRELAAYRVLQIAAKAAHEAQQAMATTGQVLRDAIQGVCAAIAPGAKP